MKQHARTRLAEERKRRKWSQQDVANAIGTTQRNVSRWELGLTTPGPYFRARLQELFAQSAQELGLVAESDVQAGPPPGEAAKMSVAPTEMLWTIPYPRNAYFTGRAALLELLARHFSSAEPGTATTMRHVTLTQPQAVKGLGGIGKTQIAVEYAYRAREQGAYAHYFWINAASREALLNSFVALADLLPAFPARGETDQDRLVAAVKQWLELCQQRWLLVFDNADDLSLIQDCLPRQGNGHLLLTTRANAVGAFALSLDVENMGLVEGTTFLLHRAQRQQASDEGYNEATNIVIALDGFPLALDQAGAYIEETGCSFQEYLQLYQDHRQTLLARRGTPATYYLDSVATTWSLSFQKVEQLNPAATELLHLCAFLAPDVIPEELLRDGATHWPPLLQQAATDLLAFNHMLRELLRFSLIKRRVENHTLSIHRLVQAIQRDQMQAQEQRAWAERVVCAVNDVFPRDVEEDITSWPRCARYLEQAQVCAALIEQYQLQLPAAADLLDRAGCYLSLHAAYPVAETLYQRALAIREQQVGPRHLSVASSLYYLASLYRLQGKYPEAEALYQRALDICEQQSEAQPALLAFIVNGLAVLYKDQGKYAEAEALFQRALQLREQHLGPEHPLIGHTLTGLAGLYHDQGKYAQAEPLYQRALRIREQHLGPDHPDVPYSLNALALLYYDRGKYEQAEPLYQRALRIREQYLGPEHPLVARPLHNLALLAYELGKYEQAEPLYQRALRIMEQHMGSEHPDIASPLTSLARLYYDRGEYQEAEPLYQRALQIREKQLGSEHPRVTYSLTGLAYLYQAQGKSPEAEQLYRRALQIIEQRLGPEHPMSSYALHGLADLCYEQGRLGKAEQLYQQSLRIIERHLGVDHPDLAAPLIGLAHLSRDQEAYEQAEPLYQRALHVQEQRLGPMHPYLAVCLASLASLYEKQGLAEQALPLYQRALAIQQRVFGQLHPKTRATSARLRAILLALHRDAESPSE